MRDRLEAPGPKPALRLLVHGVPRRQIVRHQPPVDAEITAVGIDMDGACMLMCEGQWREAMTGSIALYDRHAQRQHSIYVGAAPEHGRASFHERMEREMAHVKALYPQARFIGIADGARSNWDFLAPQVDEQILDFYHASE